MNPALNIAVFISPHGYGHATRQIAVMSAWLKRRSDLHFHVFTRVPAALFSESLSGNFTYHACDSDVGLIQKNALEEDLVASQACLDAFYPVAPQRVNALAATLAELSCVLVLCDIAPIGILAAQAAGLPSVLVENFTWDWIYEAYVDRAPGMQAHCDALAGIFEAATHHVQTQPVCRAVPRGVTVPPVFRAPRQPREVTRRALDLSDDTSMVLLTLGGGGNRWGFEAAPRAYPDTVFVTTANIPARVQHANLIELPAQNGFYHPDLVAAADCVVGKLGYSTVSEVYCAGRPFGYVTRPSFRESDPLAAFVESTLPAAAVSAEDCMSGNWVGVVPRLLEMIPAAPAPSNGADAICMFLETLL